MRYDQASSVGSTEVSGDGGSAAPGKRALTDGLRLQLKPDAAATSDGGGGGGEAAAAGGDDPFGMHLPAGGAAGGKRPIIKARPKQNPDGGIVGSESGGAEAQPAEGPAADAAAAGGGGGGGGTVRGGGAAGGVGGGGGGGGAQAAGGGVQRKAAGDGAADVQQAAQAGVAGAGGSLPHLATIQNAFGPHDVSGVVAHTDGAAQGASRAIQAEAYATGNDVAFASGSPSLHTAAHEAAHVVQQRAGVQLKGGVGEAGDAYERHADAVADRVVAGESAAELLDGAGGGGGGAAVQRKEPSAAASAATAGAEAGAAGAATATKQHYEVELKAWIPHARVVDPEEPARASDWLDSLSSLASALQPPGVSAELKYEFHSHYRGDGHSGYAGGYRVLSRASFDWDGHTVTGFRHTESYGASHRDYDYRAWLELSVGIGPFRKSLASVDVKTGSGTQTDTATSATSGSAAGSKVNLGISSANPLVMTWAPTIDSELTGTVDSSGNLAIDYTTDLFPSHGLEVKRDGAVIKTQVVNDASGVNALGPIGAINVGRRLTSHSNTGSTTAP